MYLPPPIAVGTASTDTALASLLGNVFWSQGKAYKLVKAAADIATAAAKVVVTAVSSGVPTWVVNTTTTADNGLAAGFIPANQVGSTGTTSVLSGDYFLVQVSGPGKGIINGASVAVGTALSTHTDAGEIDTVTAATAAKLGSTIAVLLETSSANTQHDIKIVNLL